MEKALQDCCRSMRIGKILIDSDPDSLEAQVVFAKFVEDIAKRKVSSDICKGAKAATIGLAPNQNLLPGASALPNSQLWEQSLQGSASSKGAPGVFGDIR